MNIDPIRPYLDLIKWGGVVMFAGVLFVGGCNHGASKWEGKFDTEAAARKADKATHDGVIKALADAAKAQEAKAKAASKQAATDRKANDQRFKDKTNEADKAKRDLAAALRAGSISLRDEWTCASTGSGEGGIAATTSRQDADANLRNAGAAGLIAAGDEADNWITWLQTELISTRQACGVTQ